VAKRVLLGAALAISIAGAAWFLLRPAQVSTTPASVRDISPTVQGVGTVEAKVTVQVSSKITGRLISVLVDQGDAVKPGQLLARLDDAEQGAQVQQAEAILKRARLAVATQEAALRKARASLAAAEATVSRVRATEALAKTNAERWHQLHAEGGVSRVEMDARVTEAAVVARELDNVEAQRRAGGEEVALLQSNLELSWQEIKVADTALATVRARQSDTVIVSPLDGDVVSRELEPGTTVNPGTPILKIADPRTAWVSVHVDERETGSIGIGNPADITLRSLPGQTLRGQVARMRRESDRVTEQLAVDIAFTDRPPRLILGEQAEATIRPAGKKGVTAIPLAALIRTPNGPGAWMVVNGRIRFRPVRIGLVDVAGWAEVVDGLRPGEQVVLAPGQLADPRNEGRRVRISIEQPTADNAK
jgi:HlyD family secretion protein